MENCETIKIHNYLEYFELKPVFVGRSEDVLLEGKRDARAVKERPWNGFETLFLDKCIFGGCP